MSKWIAVIHSSPSINIDGLLPLLSPLPPCSPSIPSPLVPHSIAIVPMQHEALLSIVRGVGRGYVILVGLRIECVMVSLRSWNWKLRPSLRRLRLKQLLNISFVDGLFKAVARLWESTNLELVTHSACAHSQLLLLLILIIRSSSDSFFLFSCSTQIFAALLRKEVARRSKSE